MDNHKENMPPALEPKGFHAAAGFVKSRPENNDYYVAQYEDHPWYPIIKFTHDELSSIIPGYNIAQIKEKFGSLRFYIEYPKELILNDRISYLSSEEQLKQRVNQLISRAEAWVDGYESRRKEERNSS